MDALVPSLLVFCVIPSFPITNRSLTNKKTRIQVIVDDRLEMGKIVTEQTISRALKSKIPLPSYKISKLVMFWCSERRINGVSDHIELAAWKTRKSILLTERLLVLSV